MSTISVAGHQIHATGMPPRAGANLGLSLVKSRTRADAKLAEAMARNRDETAIEIRPSRECAGSLVMLAGSKARLDRLVLCLLAVPTVLFLAVSYHMVQAGRPQGSTFLENLGSGLEIVVIFRLLALGACVFVMYLFVTALLAMSRGRMAVLSDADATAVVRASVARMTAGRDRIYCVTEGRSGVPGVRVVMYEGVGHCGLEDGDAVLCDRFGVELCRIPGVPSEGAARFVDHVRARIPRR